MSDVVKKSKGFLGEFKEFATRGNVLDMAVGVVIATAFGKITGSLVNDVFMPLIGYLFGGMDFSKLNLVLRPEVLSPDGATVLAEAVTIGIGAFLSTIVDFLLIAFAIFVFVKMVNRAKAKAEALLKKEEAEAEAAAVAAAEPPREEQLLTEIRDLLKERR